ncbi:MAG TPA: shikimate dehydrogenase [Flavobacterium sp.]|jgi:shikimate dehydrogenase
MENKKFGLLGRNIGYSFSKGYFTEKFRSLGLINCSYENFDIPDISSFPEIYKTDLNGMNVTIPYKEAVVPFLDELDDAAQKIGAVNTIKFLPQGQLKGFNTDHIGFHDSLKPLLRPHHRKALVLGTGGAAKAVVFAIENLAIATQYVSRRPENNSISYQDLSAELMAEYTIVVNCTPLGTKPEIDACPDIPYQFLTEKHLAYDLIYNPAETTFLQKAAHQGAVTKNGYEMLEIQAEASWKIWNS